MPDDYEKDILKTHYMVPRNLCSYVIFIDLFVKLGYTT